MTSLLLLAPLLLVVTFLVWRLAYRQRQWRQIKSKRKQSSSQSTIKTLVVLGSGGHTMEMMDLLKAFPLERYSPRVYILAQTDTTSETKALTFETQNNNKPLSESDSSLKARSSTRLSSSSNTNTNLNANAKSQSKESPRFSIEKIPRSREVAQSWISTLFTAAFSLLSSFPLVLRVCPDLVNTKK